MQALKWPGLFARHLLNRRVRQPLPKAVSDRFQCAWKNMRTVFSLEIYRKCYLTILWKAVLFADGQMSFKKFLSLKTFIVSGLLITVIPVILSVMFAISSIREISALGNSTNAEIFVQTKTLGLVLQKAADVERKARLFVLLSDPALRQPYEQQSYESTRIAFKQALKEVLNLQVDNKIVLLINELSEKEDLIYQQIINAENTSNPGLSIDDAFQGLRESASNLSREFEKVVEQRFSELRLRSASLEQGLLVKGGVLLFFTLIFIVILLSTVAPAIRQLAGAIKRLAAGELGETIIVNGPTDMQVLGHCLEVLRVHLTELEDAKQLFMQSVALEFDGPLDNLLAEMELLVTQTENAPSHEQHTLALQLCKKIEMLKAVSQELSRFSQINKSAEQGKETVNMKELAESILDSFQPQLQAKAITVMKLIRPVEIFGVYEQLQNIISQLLANAVQYSPQGGEIRIMLRDFNNQLELEVEDEGPGINVEDSAFVFEPFFRSKPPGIVGVEHGTGLGLAFVREYVANHHGKVEILASRQDQAGTRILVQIPLTQAV